jgi:hypothetical protein
MKKEKFESLNKYLAKMQDLLKSEIPPKHANRHQAYHNFLKKEIEMTKAKIEQAKLEGITNS